MFSHLRHVEAPTFVVNKDGQLTVLNPLDAFGQSHFPNATVQGIVNDAVHPTVDLGDELSDAFDQSINTPVKQFFAKNDVNLLIFFLGLLILVLGVLEARVI